MAADPIDELVELVAPPASPFRADVDWVRFREQHGVDAPTDFRSFLERYGEGRFEAPFGELRTERVSHPVRSLAEATESWRVAMRDIQDVHPDAAPWPMWPEPGGFLPMLSTDRGETVGWLTRGEPDAWTISWEGGRGAFWVDLDVGFGRFLVQFVRGALTGDLTGHLTDDGRAVTGGRAGCTFIPYAADPFLAGPKRIIEVVLAPLGARTSLASADRSHLRRRLHPEQLVSIEQGDEPGGLRLVLSCWPEDDLTLADRVVAVTAEVGARIKRVTDPDGSTRWPELWAIDPNDR